MHYGSCSFLDRSRPLPAFQKLENQPLTPEMSLQILHDEKQQIAETMSFLSR
ncbi:hypothetical protein ABXJ76_04820 [Methylobacter sp. G7]|uniref:hypothetical protein n=1 Tax=Methylobacter sp. G7 TaxID=3230117 RepID=UPI003D801443